MEVGGDVDEDEDEVNAVPYVDEDEDEVNGYLHGCTYKPYCTKHDTVPTVVPDRPATITIVASTVMGP